MIEPAGQRAYHGRVLRRREAQSDVCEHPTEKWGFDLLNPDLDELQRRWGHTEVGWRSDPARRRAGEEILERWA